MIRQHLLNELLCDGKGCFKTLEARNPITVLTDLLTHAVTTGWKINLGKNLHYCPDCARKRKK